MAPSAEQLSTSLAVGDPKTTFPSSVSWQKRTLSSARVNDRYTRVQRRSANARRRRVADELSVATRTALRRDLAHVPRSGVMAVVDLVFWCRVSRDLRTKSES